MAFACVHSYNMLLNLTRVEGADPEFMMQRSFHQFQAQKAAPGMKQALEEREGKLASMAIDGEEDLSTYHQLLEQLEITRLVSRWRWCWDRCALIVPIA